MIANAVSAGEYLPHQTAVQGRAPAGNEKSRWNAMLCQQVQQSRRGVRVRAVVEGKGNRARVPFAAAYNWKVEAQPWKKGSHEASDEKKRQWDSRTTDIDKGQNDGRLERDESRQVRRGQGNDCGTPAHLIMCSQSGPVWPCLCRREIRRAALLPPVPMNQFSFPFARSATMR